jgi:hypothetical protein
VPPEQGEALGPGVEAHRPYLLLTAAVCQRPDADGEGGRTEIPMHVASVQFKCFNVFRSMLQVFHMDVAKVDRGVVKVDQDVAMVVHICCNRLYPMFHLFFQTMLQVYLSRCCICFTHMFQVFLSACCIC